MSQEFRPAPMSLAQRAALRSTPPRTRRRSSHRSGRPPIYLIVVLLLAIVALIVAAAGFEYVYRNEIYPRVAITMPGAPAIAVGGLSQSAAGERLGSFRVIQLNRPVALRAPGSPDAVRLAFQLGYYLDRRLTVYRAYQVGRTGTPLNRFTEQVRMLAGGTLVAFVQKVDQGTLRSVLFALAPRLDRAPRPGVAGRQLDVPHAQRIITRALFNAGSFIVNLPFTAIPALPVPKPSRIHRRPPRRR